MTIVETRKATQGHHQQQKRSHILSSSHAVWQRLKNAQVSDRPSGACRGKTAYVQPTKFTLSALLPRVWLENGLLRGIVKTAVVLYHWVWDFSCLQGRSRISGCLGLGEFRAMGCVATPAYVGNEGSNSNRKKKEGLLRQFTLKAVKH